MCLFTADCICISGFWGLCPQTSTGALPLDPTGGLLSLKPSVPTLPPNPGYATGRQYPFHGFYLFINIQWLDVEMTSLMSCPPIPAKLPALLSGFTGARDSEWQWVV